MIDALFSYRGIGIFDDTHFKDTTRMNIAMHELLPASARAKRVLDMLEYGASRMKAIGARRVDD